MLGTRILHNSDKLGEHYERPKIISKSASASLSGYLSPPTSVSPVAGLQHLLEYHTLVLFVKLNFWFESETANQLGFEPWSPGPKAATLPIELHSIALFYKFGPAFDGLFYLILFLNQQWYNTIIIYMNKW